jgi:hypothetical protein
MGWVYETSGLGGRTDFIAYLAGGHSLFFWTIKIYVHYMHYVHDFFCARAFVRKAIKKQKALMVL